MAAASSPLVARSDEAASRSGLHPGPDSEEWRPIPGWDGYEASTHGNIRSLLRRTPRVLRGSSNATGHRRVVLRGKRDAGVHRLVALTFHGPAPKEAPVCRHLDGNPANNRPENLRWGTPQENSDDMISHGTRMYGESNHKAKLSEQQVLDIYARRAKGNAETLADEMGVKVWTIYKIWSGHNWGWLTSA